MLCVRSEDDLFPFLCIPGCDLLSTWLPCICTYAYRLVPLRRCTSYKQSLHNISRVNVYYLLGIIYNYRSNDITWQANLLMRLISFISNCCLTCIESLSVHIHISPSLSEELPDCNNCRNSLLYKCSEDDEGLELEVTGWVLNKM